MYKISLIGNLCADAEVKLDKYNREFIAFRVGASSRNVSKFFGVLYYTPNLDFAQYLTKGRRVYIDGGFDVKASTNDKYPDPQITVFPTTVEFCGGSGQAREEDKQARPERPAQNYKRY